jgi:phosphoribosyl-AMP cyclohydrolase
VRDWVTVRVRDYARGAASLAPGLLRMLNPELVIHDRRDALDAALSLPVAPEHYRDDFSAAFGLTAMQDEEIVERTLRLARELLPFLRERAPDVDPQPELSGYLADGTLERRLGILD